jgi:hypothetical protein
MTYSGQFYEHGQVNSLSAFYCLVHYRVNVKTREGERKKEEEVMNLLSTLKQCEIKANEQ